ncbi:site-specific DNA-methyltransferase [Sinimarinibacterium flocculans]|uniref:site-specific DNA-methyltransferase n=1 Tax=Sinimarinibacterium flocculans TaxID=985250 RepID=UPI003516E9F7
MPELNWMGDAAARRAARKVAYRLIEPVETVGEASSENLLIQGDNLEALKSLLPLYAGRVKCVFIDPPYNTRSAFEHYDDNLEHSQWLSLMYPRLVLLRELLAEDGSIWVTIDDNEGHYLKVIMDEVFGRGRFIATMNWQSRYSRSSDTAVSISHNFIFCYASNPENWKGVRNRLPRTTAQEKQFKNPDNDPRGPWRAIPWDAPNIRENLSYAIVTPSGKVRLPPAGRCWSRTEDQWKKMVGAGLAYFGRNGDGAPAFKQYLAESPPIVPNTWWAHEEVGNTDEAKKEAQELFGRSGAFVTPKPERLLHRILHIATNENDLVLDSFLGSGTTAAVAHKMGRRWIGIEMGEHARTHCLPRLKKVVEGERGGISQAVNWQGGGGFRFAKLGEPVFDADGRIHPAVRFGALATYLWFAETHTPHVDEAFDSPLLGVHGETAIVLLYNGILGDRRPQGGNVLTHAVWAHLQSLAAQHTGSWLIYGEASRLTPATLKKHGIAFRQIPYDIGAR